MISGHGSSTAPFVLIADAASKNDVDTNYALTGHAEILLRQILPQHINLDIGYRTALIKEYADQTKPVETYQDKFTQQYKDIILNEISTINPFLLIPLGELSFKYLSGLEGIRKYRGSLLLTDGSVGLSNPTKLLPILGPAPYIQQDHKNFFISRIDFDKIGKYFNHDLPPENRHNLWIAKTSSALRNFLERSYKPDGVLVFDIETFGGIPTCISFCFDGNESVCIPFLDKSIDLDNRCLMLQQVSRVLASSIAKVNQNIKYDIKCLERFGMEVCNVVGDTMLAASCLTPEFPKNLGFLNSIYTELPYFKDEGRQFDPSVHKRERYYLYNAKDSLSTRQIHDRQLDELAEIGSMEVYQNLIKCLPLYKRMENRGLRISRERVAKLLAKYESLYNIQLLKLHKLSNRALNPQSPKQVNTVVYDECGYVKGRYAKDTGEESLEHLIAFQEPKHAPITGPQILQSIMNCRRIHKVIEYLSTTLYPDERWRSEYNLAGTETGRSSAGGDGEKIPGKSKRSSDQLIVFGEKKAVELENLGRSFQTIAKHGFTIDGEIHGKDLRSIFVPSPGHVFVEIDLSQAEARVDAVLAGNYDILSVFDGPIGIHRLTGSWVYGCDPLDIKKNTKEYLISKTVRHAGERNMQAPRLVSMIQEPLKFCQGILAVFHQMQPEIKEVYHRDIRECVKSTRLLVAPNGRSRQFLDRMDEHLYNEAISQLPQCIVSDQVKFSLPPTFDECKYAHLINEAHDGTLAEVPKGYEEPYAIVYKENVEKPIDFRRGSIRREFELAIPSECSKSEESWYDLIDFEVGK